jgi:GntR family transcriptional regulator, transcriptional repressor for pyruvate dehydrogenase complex
MSTLRSILGERAAPSSAAARVRLPDAVLRPVREGNAFEACVEHLATAIRLGVFDSDETTVSRTPAQIEDALSFRRVVEPGAAWLAASGDLSADQRAWLAEALHATTTCEDDGARRVADSRLHLAVATLSGSPMLVEAVTAARSQVVELLSAIPVLTPNIAHSDEQHAEIVEAVLVGDAARAREVMEEHCDATSALLRALLC